MPTKKRVSLASSAIADTETRELLKPAVPDVRAGNIRLRFKNRAELESILKKNESKVLFSSNTTTIPISTKDHQLIWTIDDVEKTGIFMLEIFASFCQDIAMDQFNDVQSRFKKYLKVYSETMNKVSDRAFLDDLETKLKAKFEVYDQFVRDYKNNLFLKGQRDGSSLQRDNSGSKKNSTLGDDKSSQIDFLKNQLRALYSTWKIEKKHPEECHAYKKLSTTLQDLIVNFSNKLEKSKALFVSDIHKQLHSFDADTRDFVKQYIQRLLKDAKIMCFQLKALGSLKTNDSQSSKRVRDRDLGLKKTEKKKLDLELTQESYFKTKIMYQAQFEQAIVQHRETFRKSIVDRVRLLKLALSDISNSEWKYIKSRYKKFNDSFTHFAKQRDLYYTMFLQYDALEHQVTQNIHSYSKEILTRCRSDFFC